MSIVHTYRNKDYLLSDYASHHVTYSSGNKYRMSFHIKQEELVNYLLPGEPLTPEILERGSFIEIAEFIKRNIETIAWKRFLEPNDKTFWFLEHVEIQSDSEGYLVTVEYVDATFYAFEVQTQMQNVRIMRFRNDPTVIMAHGYDPADVAYIERSRIINQRSDGHAEGVEIKVPMFQFNVEYFVSQRMWKEELKDKIFNVVGKVLKYDWGGYPPNTIFVDDLTIDARPASEAVRVRWKLLYRPPFYLFLESVLGTGASPLVLLIDKPWDYRWVYALDVGVMTPLGKNMTIQDGVAYFEGRVYEYTDERVIREPS
jgi:hypothetical protein